MKTLAVGLANFSSSTEINWGVILALGTAATIMFSLIQKHFVEGMTAGAVRGRVTENSRCGAFAVYAKDTVDCKGAVPILRNEMHVSVWPGKKLAIMNVTRVAGDPLDDVSRSEATCQLRKQAVAFSRFLIQDVPGFEEAYLSKVGRGAFAHRASRSIVGEYTLTFRQGRSFADSIAQSCFPSDRHDTKGSSMLVVESNGVLDIPFRCMIPKGIGGLLVAGRCVSADKVVTGSIRMTAPCMAMGQAAGTAAALAVKSNVMPRGVDVDLLRQELILNGAVLRSANKA